MSAPSLLQSAQKHIARYHALKHTAPNAAALCLDFARINLKYARAQRVKGAK